MASVVPIPNAHAPVCGQCGRPTRLAAFAPDADGRRYMYERFRCDPCGIEMPYVRPVASSADASPSPVTPLLRASRHQAPLADAVGPPRFG